IRIASHASNYRPLIFADLHWTTPGEDDFDESILVFSHGHRDHVGSLSMILLRLPIVAEGATWSNRVPSYKRSGNRPSSIQTFRKRFKSVPPAAPRKVSNAVRVGAFALRSFHRRSSSAGARSGFPGMA